MTACFCAIPPESSAKAAAMAKMCASLVVPPMMPAAMVNLQAAASATAAIDPFADMAASALPLSKFTMPEVGFGLGPLVKIAAVLKLLPNKMALFDPIKLQAELDAMAKSIAPQAASLKAMASVNTSVMVKFSAMASVVAELKAAGLDPFEVDFAESVTEKIGSAPRPSWSPTLPLDLLPKLQFLASLPPLAEITEELDIAPGAEAAQKLSSMLKPLLPVVMMPSLPIQLMIKASMTMSMVENISENLQMGSPEARQKSAAMMRMMASANLSVTLAPPPPPPLGLPALEDVKIGMKMAKQGFFSAKTSGVAIPELSFIPTLQAVLNMRMTLAQLTKAPPIGFCTQCGV
ncbi:hypothetical protein GP644_14545 [Parasedimentitalea maritima]|uniref:Uncharacterized protein n=2 Tax=Parasedimentitalea maritima TaxID=2578117 RepID=A0A6A4REG7_9RHOB|nr:hypothetical protein GP644_14545 [Zongyanglinia marina]